MRHKGTVTSTFSDPDLKRWRVNGVAWCAFNFFFMMMNGAFSSCPPRTFLISRAGPAITAPYFSSLLRIGMFGRMEWTNGRDVKLFE